MNKRVLALAATALVCAGCQTVGSYYDRLFGSSTPAQKPAELQAFTPSAEARIAWQAKVSGTDRFAFAPALSGTAVYAAGANGELAKLDAATGKLEWQVDTGARLSAAPGTDGRIVVVGSPRGEAIAVDATGKLAWKAQLSGELLSAPAIDEGIAAVRSGDGRIFGLSVQDGKRRWVYQRSLPALMIRSPSGLNARVGGVFAGFPGGKVAALMMSNGALAWEATVSIPRGSTELERMADVVGAPLVDSSTVCAVSFQGRLGCYDVLKGTQIWARDVSSIMPLGGDARNIYLTDDKGSVHAFDRATGASLWKQDRLVGRSITGPTAVGGLVAVGDFQGYVHFLSRNDGAMAARIATDGSAILLPPVANRDAVLVQTRNGGLFNIGIR